MKEEPTINYAFALKHYNQKGRGGGTVNPKRRTMLTWRAKRRGMPKGLQATGSGHRTFPEKQLLSH